MKKLKDYLHLYLGCQFIGKYKGWAHENEIMYLVAEDLRPDKFEYIKPLLRPLSDMTEEEANEGNLWAAWHDWKKFGEDFTNDFYPEQFLYLLSKHFDLFNLIEENLAIDKSKQP